MRRKIILLVSVLVVIVAGVIFIKSPSKNTKETTTVRRQDLSEKLSFSGKIAANEDVILRFQTSGRLSWVGVKTGDYVKNIKLSPRLISEKFKTI